VNCVDAVDIDPKTSDDSGGATLLMLIRCSSVSLRPKSVRERENVEKCDRMNVTARRRSSSDSTVVNAAMDQASHVVVTHITLCTLPVRFPIRRVSLWQKSALLRSHTMSTWCSARGRMPSLPAWQAASEPASCLHVYCLVPPSTTRFFAAWYSRLTSAAHHSD
jgi:hypothetical protein